MSLNNFFARAGLENLDDETDVVVANMAPQELAEAVADQVVAQTEEQFEEIQERLEETTEAVDEIQDTVEEIEETVVAVEALVNGAYNPDAMRVLYAKAAKAANKLPSTTVGRAEVIGAEAFGDLDAVKAQVLAGCEGFMDKAKDMGKKAWDFIKRIFLAIRNFVQGLFNKQKAYIARLDQAKKRIENGKVKEKGSYGSWQYWIDPDNSTASLNTWTTEISNTSEQIETISKILGNYQNSSDKNMGLVNAVKSISDKFALKGEKDGKHFGSVRGIKLTIQYGSDTIPKGDDVPACAAYIRGSKFSSFRDSEWKDSKTGDFDVKASASDLLAGIKKLRDLLTDKVAFKKIANDFSDSKANELIAKLNAGKDTSTSDENSKKSADELAKIIQASTSFVSKAMNFTVGLTYDLVGNYVSFANACVGVKTSDSK